MPGTVVPIRHSIPPGQDGWERKWLGQLPDAETLARGLATIFGDGGRTRVEIVDREVNMSWSRSPTEIVTICQPSRPPLRVLCKYAAPDTEPPGSGRGGVRYEARVYRDVLRTSPAETPRFFGSHEPDASAAWLVIEYVDGGERLHKVAASDALPAAASWIAAFHRHWAARATDPSIGFLQVHDAAFYRAWPRRTLEFAMPLLASHPWLRESVRRADEWIAILLAGPATVVHGEFYPDNVLVGHGRVLPVDWESAALAADEIDLAALTSGPWPSGIVAGLEASYARSRWPDGAPDAFHRRLAAARIHLHYRWLGDRPERTVGDRLRWRFEQLRIESERLGVL